MNKFKLTIITPRGIFLSDEVQELYLKTSTGYQGIMAKHDSLITGVEIAPGFIVSNNKREYYAFFGGVLYISKEETKLVVNNIESASTIDLKRAQEAQKRALERLKKKEVNVDTKRAELALKRANARIECVNKKFI